MRFHSYINSAVQILKHYGGDEPFSSFLKKYFAARKKFGSRDRKQIAHLCYCYFRLGKALAEVSIEERILLGLFLCSSAPNEILSELKPDWGDNVTLPIKQKLLTIDYPTLANEVFPWQNELSHNLDYEKFVSSFFIQPDLYLRLRPGREAIVKQKLASVNMGFQEINDSCLSLENASKIEGIIEVDKEVVVQDYTSQRTGEFFQFAISNLPAGRQDLKSPINAWDCCAGSGGKSLLLYDLFPRISLTVSDARESIIANLKKRFAKAGVKNYKSFIADLTAGKRVNGRYHLIICDAPCTGSGTWSRTPEQLFTFDEKKIDHYAQLQKKILTNAVSSLKEKGLMVYVTCSVFKKENEEVAAFIQHDLGLQLVETQVLTGYDKKADTMFVALFRKSEPDKLF